MPQDDANQTHPYERLEGCVHCTELLLTTEGVVLDFYYWRVLVSRDQGYLGRCMIIARDHAADESGIDEQAALEFHWIKIAFEEAVRTAFGARICNWTQLSNDAFQDEDPKPHLHHHVRPRYEHPVEFAGTRFEDPNWGHMYDLDQRWNIDETLEGPELKEQIAAQIREAWPQT
jgi:diadenosine tetraphosphate (Ap4A) HIT family hydrolase